METSLLETILYIAFGLVTVVGALSVILSRNVIYSALGMLANFSALGALYIMLSAEFLGIVQMIVYAGAVVVLFLFALMFVGGRATVKERLLRPFINIIAIAFGVLLLTQMVYLVLSTAVTGQVGSFSPEVIGQIGNVQAIGSALLSEYLLPFQMVAVLLLVGLVGAVALAKPRQEGEN